MYHGLQIWLYLMIFQWTVNHKSGQNKTFSDEPWTTNMAIFGIYWMNHEPQNVYILQFFRYTMNHKSVIFWPYLDEPRTTKHMNYRLFFMDHEPQNRPFYKNFQCTMDYKYGYFGHYLDVLWTVDYNKNILWCMIYRKPHQFVYIFCIYFMHHAP